METTTKIDNYALLTSRSGKTYFGEIISQSDESTFTLRGYEVFDKVIPVGTQQGPQLMKNAALFPIGVANGSVIVTVSGVLEEVLMKSQTETVKRDFLQWLQEYEKEQTRKSAADMGIVLATPRAPVDPRNNAAPFHFPSRNA